MPPSVIQNAPNDQLKASMIEAKERFDYSINISSDRMYRTHNVEDMFKKLASIVTLKLDRKLLKTKKPHLIPKQERTILILFPESKSKASDGKKSTIAHMHGFLALPDVELSSFQEAMALSDLRFWLHVYALKLGLVRRRNRKNHQVGYTKKLKEEDMKELLIQYGMKQQDERYCEGESIFIGAKLFNPFA